MNYIIYTTPWTEGEVVACVTDEAFPIGVDHTTNEVLYADLDELMTVEGLVLRTESDIVTAARCDTACYGRMYSDLEEYEHYLRLRHTFMKQAEEDQLYPLYPV